MEHHKVMKIVARQCILWHSEIRRSRKKSSESSPRRKPGSRSPWYSWIPAFAGMTKNRVCGLFTNASRLTFS